ncbi:hypothetical protein HAX54_041019, partial [Datura stramonium]|nr:hypothetical protein [Datura stramonium]
PYHHSQEFLNIGEATQQLESNAPPQSHFFYDNIDSRFQRFTLLSGLLSRISRHFLK